MAEELSATLANDPDEIIARRIFETPLEEDIHTSPLAGEILYVRNEPARWARICELALDRFDMPFERRIGLGLEVVNGLRRMPGRWDIGRARLMLESVSLLIASLPEMNFFKAQLGALSLYHGGIVEHAGGNFLQAALCHELAAWALGASPLARSIAGFMAANERINGALVKGAPGEELLEQFADRDQELQGILDMTTAEGRRWECNRLCFRLRAAWLTDGAMLWGDLGKIWSSCQEFGPAFIGPLHILQAAFQGGSVGPESVQKLLAFTASEGDLDWRSEGLLVVANFYHAHGNLGATLITLRKILAMESEGHGGHVARAIARRMLQGGDGK